MKKKKSPFGLIIAALITLAVVLLVRHFHIKNFQIIEKEVLYTSGQPRGMDYTRLLYKYHIATIINVRCVSEHRERNWYNEEITWVRKNGVNYKELPIDKSLSREKYFPDEWTQKEFLQVMSQKENLPVLVHGSSGRKRVSMLAAVWMIKSKNLTVLQTVKKVRKINDDRELTDAEMKFINSLAK